MKTGMLWFDSSAASLEVRIKKAAEYYEKKYGAKPNLCFVPLKLLDGEKTIGNITVKPTRSVLQHHLYLGVDNG